MVLKGTFKNALHQWSSKGPIGGKCSGSTAAAVLCQRSVEEAGLVSADVLLVVVVGGKVAMVASWVVKTAAVCQSVDSSSQIEDFQRSLRLLICFVDFLRL